MINRLDFYLRQYAYLTRLFLFFVYSTNVFASSAYMPSDKKFKLSFSANIANLASYLEKQKRTEEYGKIEKEIYRLEHKEKLRGIEKILLNQLKIEKDNLRAYQEKVFYSLSFEEGVKNNNSFGLNGIFTQSVSPSVYSSNFTKVGIFYKRKLFERKNFITSMQTQMIVKKRAKRTEELYNESAFMIGVNKSYKKTDNFFDASIVTSLLTKNKSYSISTSEGSKFKNGIMIVAYTKYTLREKCNPVYRKTLYNQLSIAKEFNLTGSNNLKLTVLIGMFTDRSLTYKEYYTKGTAFSIWLNT